MNLSKSMLSLSRAVFSFWISTNSKASLFSLASSTDCLSCSLIWFSRLSRRSFSSALARMLRSSSFYSAVILRLRRSLASFSSRSRQFCILTCSSSPYLMVIVRSIILCLSCSLKQAFLASSLLWLRWSSILVFWISSNCLSSIASLIC
jgi:hypothetical protein